METEACDCVPVKDVLQKQAAGEVWLIGSTDPGLVPHIYAGQLQLIDLDSSHLHPPLRVEMTLSSVKSPRIFSYYAFFQDNLIRFTFYAHDSKIMISSLNPYLEIQALMA